MIPVKHPMRAKNVIYFLLTEERGLVAEQKQVHQSTSLLSDMSQHMNNIPHCLWLLLAASCF